MRQEEDSSREMEVGEEIEASFGAMLLGLVTLVHNVFYLLHRLETSDYHMGKVKQERQFFTILAQFRLIVERMEEESVWKRKFPQTRSKKVTG